MPKRRRKSLPKFIVVLFLAIFLFMAYYASQQIAIFQAQAQLVCTDTLIQACKNQGKTCRNGKCVAKSTPKKNARPAPKRAKNPSTKSYCTDTLIQACRNQGKSCRNGKCIASVQGICTTQLNRICRNQSKTCKRGKCVIKPTTSPRLLNQQIRKCQRLGKVPKLSNGKVKCINAACTSIAKRFCNTLPGRKKCQVVSGRPKCVEGGPCTEQKAANCRLKGQVCKNVGNKATCVSGGTGCSAQNRAICAGRGGLTCKNNACVVAGTGCTPEQVNRCKANNTKNTSCKNGVCVVPGTAGCTEEQVSRCFASNNRSCRDGSCVERNGCTVAETQSCKSLNQFCKHGFCVVPGTGCTPSEISSCKNTDKKNCRNGRCVKLTDEQILLQSTRISFSENARYDLLNGNVKPEVLKILQELLRNHRLVIGNFMTGHSKYVRGSRTISDHWYGCAVDIMHVDGRPVNSSNAGALQIVRNLADLNSSKRPEEVGSPFSQYNNISGFFSAGHGGHLHIGFEGSCITGR